MASPSRLVTFDADPAAGHQAQVAVGHDRFADGLRPLLITVSRPRRPLDDDRAVFDGVIGFDDEGVLPLLADLNGRGRDDDRRGVRRQRDVDVDELARPEPAIVVRERAP